MRPTTRARLCSLPAWSKTKRAPQRRVPKRAGRLETSQRRESRWQTRSITPTPNPKAKTPVFPARPERRTSVFRTVEWAGAGLPNDRILSVRWALSATIGDARHGGKLLWADGGLTGGSQTVMIREWAWITCFCRVNLVFRFMGDGIWSGVIKRAGRWL